MHLQELFIWAYKHQCIHTSNQQYIFNLGAWFEIICSSGTIAGGREGRECNNTIKGRKCVDDVFNSKFIGWLIPTLVTSSCKRFLKGFLLTLDYSTHIFSQLDPKRQKTKGLQKLNPNSSVPCFLISESGFLVEMPAQDKWRDWWLKAYMKSCFRQRYRSSEYPKCHGDFLWELKPLGHLLCQKISLKWITQMPRYRCELKSASHLLLRLYTSSSTSRPTRSCPSIYQSWNCNKYQCLLLYRVLKMSVPKLCLLSL